MTPVVIENRQRSGVLAVAWDDGSTAILPHALLRCACPCAECRASRRAGTAIVAPAEVRLATITAAGHNALQLTFTDGHARGIYPFPLLRELRPTE
jgi:DUF971 family protein